MTNSKKNYGLPTFYYNRFDIRLKLHFQATLHSLNTSEPYVQCLLRIATRPPAHRRQRSSASPHCGRIDI